MTAIAQPARRRADPIPDEIAVERCVAGTLHARRLTVAERRAVVAELTRRGLGIRVIAARTGMAARTVTRIRGRLAES